MNQDKIKRQDEYTGTKPVDDGLGLDAAVLEPYLAGEIEGFSGPLAISQFKGGQSNPTYLLETPGKAYVLRRKPPGRLLPSAHAVDREFRVIQALYALSFPVARPYVLCMDDDVAGTAFYVMDYVEGHIIWEPHMPGADKAERAGVYDQLNATIARLHTIDIGRAGQSDYGRPQGYVTRQIKR